MTTTNLGMTIPTVGADADSWGGELNTDLGLIDAFAGSLMPQAEVTLASAATTDIGGAASTAIAISGTTTITSFGAAANKIRFVRFTGALMLTHNAASLILLGAANRATAAGDSGIYQSDGSGNWREKAYFTAGYNPGAHTGTGAYVHALGPIASGNINGLKSVYSGFISASGTDTGITPQAIDGQAQGAMALCYVSAQNGAGTYSAIYMLRFGFISPSVAATRVSLDAGSTGVGDFIFSVNGASHLVVTAPTSMNVLITIHRLDG